MLLAGGNYIVTLFQYGKDHLEKVTHTRLGCRMAVCPATAGSLLGTTVPLCCATRSADLNIDKTPFSSLSNELATHLRLVY